MKNKVKKTIEKIPLINTIAIYIFTFFKRFPGSREYWEQRYSRGESSGVGSYGKLAQFKAEVINSFVKENKIDSVIDFGCGDGNVLSLLNFANYIGLDVSRNAIKVCISRFRDDKTKSFFLYDSECFKDNNSILSADLGLSLDVIYHLIEDDIFERYMKHLFSSSNRFVIIYSDDVNTNQKYHVKHRQFSKWIEANLLEWKLIKKIKNKYPKESCADFFIFKKIK